MLKRVSIVVILVFLVGCSKDDSFNVNEQEMLTSVGDFSIEAELETEDMDTVLDIWLPRDYLAYDDTQFLGNNPDITVQYTYKSVDTVNQYISGLLSEDVPDVLVVTLNDFGVFSNLDVFEDLQYLLNDIDLSDDPFESLGHSDFGDSRVGLMVNYAPVLTYYRKDIIEDLGLDGSPDKVQGYLADSDMFMDLSNQLNAQGMYVMQWADDFNTLIASNSGFYRHEDGYFRADTSYENLYEFSVEAYAKGSAALIDFWSDSGSAAIQNNQMVMVYLGTYGINELSNKAPEQTGMWQITGLPFEMNAYEGYFMMIPSHAKHKEAALRWVADKYVSEVLYWDYLTTSSFSYLDSQNISAYMEETLVATENRIFTLLDAKLNQLYKGQFNEGLSNSIDFSVFNERFNKAMMDAYEFEMNNLLLMSE